MNPTPSVKEKVSSFPFCDRYKAWTPLVVVGRFPLSNDDDFEDVSGGIGSPASSSAPKASSTDWTLYLRRFFEHMCSMVFVS